MMISKTWTIFGAGHFFNDINDAIESNNQKCKLLVLNMELSEEILRKIPSHIKVIDIANFKPSTDYYLFGFLNPDKKPFLDLLRGFDVPLSNLSHKYSYVAGTVMMGNGNFVGAGAVVAPNVSIGDFNYINRNASVGHDTVIGDFNHIGPGSAVAGLCKIGNRNFLGIGSIVRDKIEIKDRVTIGAGGVVVNNILEKGTYIGIPVKKIN
jgi:sugar O-acyltransferase (sialic acid O-acetyltransferase NeuD family)